MKMLLTLLTASALCATATAAPYAILTADRAAVREVREFDKLPPHKPGRVLPIIDDARPAANDSQKIVEAALVIEGARVRRTWAVVSLGASELAEQAERAAIEAIAAKLAAGAGLTIAEERALRLYLIRRVR